MPCKGRHLTLVNNNDGTITIDGQLFCSIEEVEELLISVKRKDLSKDGKVY